MTIYLEGLKNVFQYLFFFNRSVTDLPASIDIHYHNRGKNVLKL